MISWVESCLVESGQRLRSVRRSKESRVSDREQQRWAFYLSNRGTIRIIVSTYPRSRYCEDLPVHLWINEDVMENDKTGEEAKRNDAVTMLVTEKRGR